MALWQRALAASAQCPNLAGNYAIEGEDGKVYISIEQHACESVSIVRKSDYLGTITFEKHVLKLDGKVQNDSPWLGGSEQYRTSARFVGSALRVEARSTSSAVLAVIYSLTSRRDLIEAVTINGHGSPVVAKRQE